VVNRRERETADMESDRFRGAVVRKGNHRHLRHQHKDFTAIKRMEDALEAESDRVRITTAELEAKNAQLEADLRRAREVQLALLPGEYPTLTGYGVSGHPPYRPVAAVGGHFFDFFPLSQDRVGVFICFDDV
jgi:serine phosphatase RsbU (regulator of sigma subunit)